MLDYLRTGGDVHDMTTKMVFGLDKETADPELFDARRDVAKGITFGIVYGQGIPSLSKKLGIPEDECRQLMQKFKNGISGFEKLSSGLMRILYDRQREEGTGWVKSLYDRKYYLDPQMFYKGLKSDCTGYCRGVRQ